MSSRGHVILATLLFGSLLATTVSAGAEGTVELELVTEQRTPITAQQEWLRRLVQAGVTNLRIRGGRSGDKIGIEVRGSEQSPIYVVTGVITSGDALHVPGGRFTPADVGRLTQWLDELARLGPPERRPPKAAFGLDVGTFAQLHDDLAQPVAFSTEGLSRAEVVTKVSKQVRVPLRIDAESLRSAEAEKVAEELSGISCGTALAYVVRPLGLCLVPHATVPGGAELTIRQAGPEVEAWPIGWKPKKPDRDVLPALFQFFNVNLQGVAVPTVLDALAARLEVPILLDYNALARHGVEPESVLVTVPQSRTTYSLLLGKVLFQARLKSELRVDEAGKPLLWVTTLKPI